MICSCLVTDQILLLFYPTKPSGLESHAPRSDQTAEAYFQSLLPRNLASIICQLCMLTGKPGKGADFLPCIPSPMDLTTIPPNFVRLTLPTRRNHHLRNIFLPVSVESRKPTLQRPFSFPSLFFLAFLPPQCNTTVASLPRRCYKSS